MATVPLFQPTELPPKKVGQAKPSFALADRSGEQYICMQMPKNGEGNDLYTFEEWLKVCVWSYVRGEIKQGK